MCLDSFLRVFQVVFVSNVAVQTKPLPPPVPPHIIYKTVSAQTEIALTSVICSDR